LTLVRPFRALRYDPARVDLGRVIVPPYDVIAPDERTALYARDPHSAIRLELTCDVEEESITDYSEIHQALDDWRRTGVLIRDPRAALYGLRQRFTAPDGSSETREGFFALLRLEDYDRRVVRPHERTLAGPKADRLKVLRAARANLSSVFLLYEDRDLELARILAPTFAADPLASARDEWGSLHTLVAEEDPARIEAVRTFLAERPLVIADGHHRYETALAYRDERRARAGVSEPDAPYEWILAYFANAFAPGSLLLPIHRVIRNGPAPTERAWSERLPGWTQLTVPVADAEQVPALLAQHLVPLRNRYAFAADDGSGALRVFSKPAVRDGEIGVRVVHREVVGGVFGFDEAAVREGAISYPKDAVRAAREVRVGRGAVALYLNPLAPDDVFRVTAAGEVLPQKSTFFFPKLPTGLVFRLHDENRA
jgi:uncharacterized protein (DUF1015 family)